MVDSRFQAQGLRRFLSLKGLGFKACVEFCFKGLGLRAYVEFKELMSPPRGPYNVGTGTLIV